MIYEPSTFYIFQKDIDKDYFSVQFISSMQKNEEELVNDLKPRNTRKKIALGYNLKLYRAIKEIILSIALTFYQCQPNEADVKVLEKYKPEVLSSLQEKINKPQYEYDNKLLEKFYSNKNIKIKKITRNPTFLHSYEWSRDKSRIAFFDEYLHLYYLVDNEIIILDLKGSNPHWISKNEIIFIDSYKQFLILNIHTEKVIKIFPLIRQSLINLENIPLGKYNISPNRNYIVFSIPLSNAEGTGNFFGLINIKEQKITDFYRYSCRERNFSSAICKDEINSITNESTMINDGLNFYEYNFITLKLKKTDFIDNSKGILDFKFISHKYKGNSYPARDEKYHTDYLTLYTKKGRGYEKIFDFFVIGFLSSYENGLPELIRKDLFSIVINDQLLLVEF